MFEELFTLPRALEKHRTAPLAEQRLRYLQHLKGVDTISQGNRTEPSYIGWDDALRSAL